MNFNIRWRGAIDLQTEHERYLTEEIFKKSGIRHRLSEGDQGVLHEDE